MKMVPQQYCLRWKHHHSNVQNMFAQLLEKERFCDVTLYCMPSLTAQNSTAAAKDGFAPEQCRGVSLKAHRVVLAACSELLGALLGAHESQGEPVLVIDGADPRHMRALLDYMYTGEMNVHHSQLASLLKTAEELRIKGLTDIRWNNKDEPPDCHSGAITATRTTTPTIPEPQQQHHYQKKSESKPIVENKPILVHEADPLLLEDDCVTETVPTKVEKPMERINNLNGGPPPLIKLPTRTSDKSSPLKRELPESDSPSPKRKRLPSTTEHTDEEDKEWQHGNLDISAEPVVGWFDTSMTGSCGGGGGGGASDSGAGEAGGWSREPSDDEWGDAPADIGSFLHTKLRVSGDNSADDDSNEDMAPSTSSETAHIDLPNTKKGGKTATAPDPRFPDVVKLNDYLKHGRRPQFWEENYVKRVMEAVRIKELEMKQAAEILGVSYGTLYGRYRDVFGCINRPYRTARDFWGAKGPSEILDRLQRGTITLDAGAVALGVSPANLAAYMADLTSTQHHDEKDFEPIPIEIDPSLKKMTAALTGGACAASPSGVVKAMRKNFNQSEKKKVSVSSVNDEDSIPVSVISAQESKKSPVGGNNVSGGKWPSIRVASLDSLRGTEPSAASSGFGHVTPASPTHLMRTRPDLTIIAAKKPDTKRDEEDT